MNTEDTLSQQTKDVDYYFSSTFGTHRYTVSTATIGILYASVATFGLFANGVIFATLMVIGGLRHKATSIFVACLAFSDIVLCVFNAPIQLYYELVEPSEMSKITCRVLFASLGIPTHVSCILILLIAIDRYLSVLYPLRRRISATKAGILLVSSVLFSIVSAFPVAYFTDVQQAAMNLHDDSDTPNYLTEQKFPQYCVERWPSPQLRLAYTVAVFVGQFFAPLIFTAMLYIRIGISLSSRRQVLRTEKNKEIRDVSPALPLASSRYPAVVCCKFCCPNRSHQVSGSDLPLALPNANSDIANDSENSTEVRIACSNKTISHLASRLEHRTRRTHRILVSIVTCFIICWTPWMIYSLYLEYFAYWLSTMASRQQPREFTAAFSNLFPLTDFQNQTDPRILKLGHKNITSTPAQLVDANLKLMDLFLKLFALSSTCTNPFFYGWLNENIRTFLIRVLRRVKLPNKKATMSRNYSPKNCPRLDSAVLPAAVVNSIGMATRTGINIHKISPSTDCGLDASDIEGIISNNNKPNDRKCVITCLQQTDL